MTPKTEEFKTAISLVRERIAIKITNQSHEEDKD